MRKEGKALSSYFQILRKESINGESWFFFGGGASALCDVL